MVDVSSTWVRYGLRATQEEFEPFIAGVTESRAAWIQGRGRGAMRLTTSLSQK